MKIYEIGTGYTPIPAQMGAATEIVVEELTKAFLKQNVPVEIVDIAADHRAAHSLPIREVKVPKCFSSTDVQLGIMHKLKRVAYSVALAFELRKVLRNAHEKVVLHFHNQYNLFFFLKLTPPALRQKCMIAYTNHSGIWRLQWEAIAQTIKKRYFQEAVCMEQADLVFLLNEETKQNVMNHLAVREERIVCIGNGVNTEIYRPLPKEERQKAKKKWGFEGKNVILQVGSVYENKGQLRALEYLMPILKKRPDCVYAYAGGIVDKEYQEKIQSFTAEHNLTEQIRYLGMIAPGAALNELYNTATMTIFPSRYESFGMVVVESFAAGIPVILEENGPVQFESGSIVCRGESISEIVDFMITNGTENYRQLCFTARKNAQERFEWEKVAFTYSRVFMQEQQEKPLCEFR